MAVRTAEADLVVMLAAKMAEVDLEELGVMVAVGRMAEALEVSMEMVVIRAAVAMRDDNTNNLLPGPEHILQIPQGVFAGGLRATMGLSQAQSDHIHHLASCQSARC